MTTHSLFITATDTGIGKTFISRLLADTLAVNTAVTYMKPVQTGCESFDKEGLRAPDYEYVMQGAARPVLDLNIHVPYRFKLPASPP